MKRWN